MTYIHELADWPKLHKAQVWRQVNNHSLNDRQRQAINRMLADWRGHLTTSKYAKLAKCSTDTALRDIRSLTPCAAAGACLSPAPSLWYAPPGQRGADTFPAAPRAWLRLRRGASAICLGRNFGNPFRNRRLADADFR